MEIGDGIALVSAVVALIAMVVAWRQASEASKSRKAAQDQAVSSARSATAAEEQVAMAREGLEREQQARAEQEAAQARLVRMAVTGSGGLAVEVTNESDQAVFYVEIKRYESQVFPNATWRRNPRVIGAEHPRHILQAGKMCWFPIELVDDGEPVGFGANLGRLAEDKPTVSIRFEDASEIYWRRINNGPPERIGPIGSE